VIKRGEHDARVVRQIQARLNVIFKGRIAANGNTPFRGSGVFGAITEEAVKEFQRHSRLEVDGKIGKDTWPRLFGS
jgi:peptidoglycan hydrolase-like protein with peptidoglycan-binding domain